MLPHAGADAPRLIEDAPKVVKLRHFQKAEGHRRRRLRPCCGQIPSIVLGCSVCPTQRSQELWRGARELALDV